MEGRRVSRRKPRRNPLYVLFMGLLALSLVLLITVVVLGFKLKSARSDLAAAQTKIEQLRGERDTALKAQADTLLTQRDLMAEIAALKDRLAASEQRAAVAEAKVEVMTQLKDE